MRKVKRILQLWLSLAAFIGSIFLFCKSAESGSVWVLLAYIVGMCAFFTSLLDDIIDYVNDKIEHKVNINGEELKSVLNRARTH